MLFRSVFDGDSSYFDQETSAANGVRVVFTAANETADSRILKLVNDYGDIYEYTVVSDDREVRRGAKLAGAKVISVADFAGVKRRRILGDERTGSEEVSDKNMLSPGLKRAINESLMREWGID